jgi:N-acetylglutamate synthase-like GNAT family acetyltransferase
MKANGPVAIGHATDADLASIEQLYRSVGRPARSTVSVGDYFVATHGPVVVGCAAVTQVGPWGYLYGLAVDRAYRRMGIGSRLTVARIRSIRERGGLAAIVMAMFWNVRFFRRLGFRLTRRNDLPQAVLEMSDFQNPVYRRSAVLSLFFTGAKRTDNG